MKILLIILLLTCLALATSLAVILSWAKSSGRIKYKLSTVEFKVFRLFPCWLPGSWGVSGCYTWNQDKDAFIQAIAPTECVMYAWLWFRVEAKVINDYYFPLDYPDNSGTTLDLERYRANGTVEICENAMKSARNN